MQINGVSAVVTGANGGLGRCLVEQLRARGAGRVYAAGRERASLDAVVSADPDRVSPLVLDVTDETQALAAAESATDAKLLFNNAGVMAFGTPLDADLDLLERDMVVNYLGTLRVTRAFVPVLKANGGGTVVNILSMLAFAPITGMSPYCASKAAALSMTQALRHQLADSGVSVLGVYPWGMNTPMLAGVDSPKAEPADVARAVLDGVESGSEDIAPDQFSSDAYAGWRKDPKALEQQLAAY
jgi:NAD(P)-dependent dehydrogenase (short-subunit alcohol dehydrogenase family)